MQGASGFGVHGCRWVQRGARSGCRPDLWITAVRIACRYAPGVIPWIVLLYGAGAVMPIVGLVGLYRKARAEAVRFDEGLEGAPDDSWQALIATLPTTVSAIRRRPAAVVLDLALIGGGVAASTAASIWSLFI